MLANPTRFRYRFGLAGIAVVVGVLMGYVSLAGDPFGMLAVAAFTALLAASSRRASALGPYLFGLGASGAWLFAPGPDEHRPRGYVPNRDGSHPVAGLRDRGSVRASAHRP